MYARLLFVDDDDDERHPPKNAASTGISVELPTPVRPCLRSQLPFPAPCPAVVDLSASDSDGGAPNSEASVHIVSPAPSPVLVKQL
ncbi:hypothetical protein HYPSUDRAFT_208061 [Hypholoma sublateritium FD-334 SS-4]|uniref:Uncharacterized protein n=1 Tax=Hypholoma sublateritium (strain FD-334 SS-4) TaxID=945553 RepID=A0A0D2LWI5_HYPSF|nr:hypothetical protein HYPSUDRAFT_208061 [Hypholoma sublateritium FD-334 SS-4]